MQASILREVQAQMTEQGKDEKKIKAARARAKALTPEERSAIAKEAAIARWNMPKATHKGVLNVAGVEIPCYVLEDGRRVLYQRGIIPALGMARGASSQGRGDRLAIFMSGKVVSEFASNELLEVTKSPFRFMTDRGTAAYGYEATTLVEICDAVIEARNSGRLQAQQLHIARRCEVLLRAFAKVGIVALVDEATGYQYDRARNALEKILEEFINNELQKWIKTFPDEFYKQIARLNNYELKNINKRGVRYAQLTNNLIYRRLAPGVLEELKRITPKNDKGRRKHKYFQRLTQDIGHPALRELLSNQIVLMKLFPDGAWKDFEKAMNRVIPIYGNLPLFDAVEEKENATLTTASQQLS